MESVDVKRPQSLILRDAAAGLGVAAAVFALSYANGGYFPTTRSYAGIAAWWLLGVGAAIGLASAWAAINRLALVALGLFAAFAVWILISVGWASDAERAFAQFNQVALYVAVLAIAIVLARLLQARVLVGGVALALSAIAAVALVSRFFPSTFGVSPGAQAQFLQPLKYRLSFPLGYWNGLGIEVALAFPLLLSIMTSRRSRLASALAALPLPLLAAVMYLTSSRGAFAAAAVGIVAFLALTPKRWPALAAVVVAGVAGAAAVAVLVPKKALVNGDVNTPLGAQQGHHAALWLGAACVLTAVVWAGLAELGTRLPTPSRRVGQVTAAVLIVLAVAAIALSHPIAKFDRFKSNPTIANTHGTETTNHLLNSSGSGRWQFWSAAVSEFRAHPLNGGGAGSWQAWWLLHNSLKIASEFAHSLYLESLAELGMIGLLLIAAAVLTALVGAVRSALALASAEVAAAAACGLAFFVAAAYDWVWQLAGIAVVGVGMLGVALGALPATRATAWGRAGIVRPAIAVLAVAAIIPQFVVLAAGSHLRNGQDAFYASDAARRVRSFSPRGRSSPGRQLLPLARAHRRGRGESASRLWLAERRDQRLEAGLPALAAAAIIETKRGNALAAKRDLAEAQRLNPNYRQLLQTTP